MAEKTKKPETTESIEELISGITSEKSKNSKEDSEVEANNDLVISGNEVRKLFDYLDQLPSIDDIEIVDKKIASTINSSNSTIIYADLSKLSSIENWQLSNYKVKSKTIKILSNDFNYDLVVSHEEQSTVILFKDKKDNVKNKFKYSNRILLNNSFELETYKEYENEQKDAISFIINNELFNKVKSLVNLYNESATIIVEQTGDIKVSIKTSDRVNNIELMMGKLDKYENNEDIEIKIIFDAFINMPFENDVTVKLTYDSENSTSIISFSGKIKGVDTTIVGKLECSGDDELIPGDIADEFKLFNDNE